MKTIYSKSIFLLLMTFFFSTFSFAQYKIQGPGISPSKDTVYAGIKYEYRVVNFPNTRTLMWQTLWGALDGRDGESVKITWDNVPQGSITVTGFNGTSNVIMEAKVKISGIKPDPKPDPEPEPDPKPEKPSAPQFVKQEYGKYYFTNIPEASKYKWTLPDGCVSPYGTGTFIHTKEILNGNAYIQLDNNQVYVEGDIKVQAISDKGSLLSDVTKTNYKKLNADLLKVTECPVFIEYGNTKTYTIAIEYIPGATYNWTASHGSSIPNDDNISIISGQGTNKITLKPNYPFAVYSVISTISINGLSGNCTPIIMNVPNSGEIVGPDIIYGTNTIHYTISTESPFIPSIVTWYLDNKNKGYADYEGGITINTDELSIGNHVLEAAYIDMANPEFIFARKLITKYKDPICSILYDQSAKNLKISKTQSIKESKNIDVQIFTQQGVIVLSKKISNINQDYQIDVTTLNKGIYFVVASDGVNKVNKTIIIN